MGLFSRLFAGNLYGSYGETARSIATSYRFISGDGQAIRNNDDVKHVFTALVNSRYQSAVEAGKSKGNRLNDFNWYLSYESNFFTIMADKEKLHYNLPTFCFIVMFLESLQKRKELKDGKILKDVIQVIHDETNKVFKRQTLLTLEEFTVCILKIIDNMHTSNKVMDSMEEFC